MITLKVGDMLQNTRTENRAGKLVGTNKTRISVEFPRMTFNRIQQKTENFMHDLFRFVLFFEILYIGIDFFNVYYQTNCKNAEVCRKLQ